ncbi:MAG: TetR/AcrR family transcriptional regulator [Syntrophorhabdales bacterium]|jgi:AcrR family transcriptional regulator
MSPRISAERREEYVEGRRNQILDGAIAVFGNKGLDLATMDEIARAVGISKGTIYLYFKGKEEIFDAILSERSLIPQIVDLIDSTDIPLDSPDLSLQSCLEQIGKRYMSGIDHHYPLLRLLLADSHKAPIQAEHIYNNFVLKADQKLAELLIAQAKAGKVRKLHSPLMTARCFLGMLLAYVITQEVLGGRRFTPIQREEWVEEAVRVFLRGVETNGQAIGGEHDGKRDRLSRHPQGRNRTGKIPHGTLETRR